MKKGKHCWKCRNVKWTDLKNLKVEVVAEVVVAEVEVVIAEVAVVVAEVVVVVVVAEVVVEDAVVGEVVV